MSEILQNNLREYGNMMGDSTELENSMKEMNEELQTLNSNCSSIDNESSNEVYFGNVFDKLKAGFNVNNYLRENSTN